MKNRPTFALARTLFGRLALSRNASVDEASDLRLREQIQSQVNSATQTLRFVANFFHLVHVDTT
jgi:hypothetical protein